MGLRVLQWCHPMLACATRTSHCTRIATLYGAWKVDSGPPTVETFFSLHITCHDFTRKRGNLKVQRMKRKLGLLLIFPKACLPTCTQAGFKTRICPNSLDLYKGFACLTGGQSLYKFKPLAKGKEVNQHKA